MAKDITLTLGGGNTAVGIRASLEQLIQSLTPRLQKMTAKELQAYMQPAIDKAFRGVVRKWRSLLTRKGIDSTWSKPSGEDHIYNALVSGPMKVSAAGRFRKIIEWEIQSAVNHLQFALTGFGDVSATSVSVWGRQASLAAWANNKFGWNIPVSGGVVRPRSAKAVTVLFGGRRVDGWSALMGLSRAVNDNRLRAYGLAEALDRYITTAVFSDEELIGAFLELTSDFDF